MWLHLLETITESQLLVSFLMCVTSRSLGQVAETWGRSEGTEKAGGKAPW
jgi:hypothetical protein